MWKAASLSFHRTSFTKGAEKMQTNAHRRGLFSSVSSSSTSSSQPYPRCLRKVVAYASFPPSVPMLTLMSWALMEPLSSRGECQTSPFTHGCLKDSSLTGQKEGWTVEVNLIEIKIYNTISELILHLMAKVRINHKQMCHPPVLSYSFTRSNWVELLKPRKGA